MSEQWKNVSMFELGASHLGKTTKVTFDDSSIVLGRLLGINHQVREGRDAWEHAASVTILIAGNGERFDLEESKGISVLEADTET